MRAERLRPLLAAGLLLAALAIPVLGTEVAAAPSCGGEPATIVGTEGDDALRGTPGRDVIVGLAGDDDIGGVDGRDRLCGGPGDDRLYGGHHDDRLIGGPGDDFLVGGGGADRIFGDEGDDRLSGAPPVDIFDGGAGSDECGGSGDTKTNRNCEWADLSFDIHLPDQLGIGPNPMGVTVANAGPDGATYWFAVTAQEADAPPSRGGPPESPYCHVVEATGQVPQPLLPAGAQRVHELTLDCPVDPGAGVTVLLYAYANPGLAADTDTSNNELDYVVRLAGATASVAPVESTPPSREPSSSPAP